MRSIKQIIREVKKEVIKIIEEENNQDLVYLETDNYLDEENIENDMFDYENDSIEKLHDFIIENYNKDEITILFKYLITHFLSSNTELLTSYLLSDNNNNTVYKNMITTRLRVIFEELNIFSPDILPHCKPVSPADRLSSRGSRGLSYLSASAFFWILAATSTDRYLRS